MHPSVQEAFVPFTVPLEARVRFMYLDVKSLVTTGIGNLIDQDDPNNFGSNAKLVAGAYELDWAEKDTGAPADRGTVDQEYRTVKFSGTAGQPIGQRELITSLRISDGAIDELVAAKLRSNEATLRNRPEFAAFDGWPADAQLGLLSMTWAMGGAFDFPLFEAAAAAGDWITAARQSRIGEAGNPGLRPRNVRNGLLFTIAGWVDAPPPGDFAALVYDPSIPVADNMRSGSFPVPLNLDIGVQTALEQVGYDPNGLDGGFGRGTRIALTNFQRDAGLPQTPAASGVDDIGADTVAALTRALDDRQIQHWPV